MYLNTHSYFSFRYGTIPPKALLAEAQRNGVQTMVLTDINTTAACLNFVRLAPEYGIKPLIGVDFRNGNQQQFIGIARNNEGFLELNQFLSYHLHREEDFPPKAPDWNHVWVIYPFRSFQGQPLGDHAFIGVCPDELNRLPFSRWKHLIDQMVILQTVTFRGKVDFNSHRLLRAIDQNTLLSKLDQKEQGKPTDRMELDSRLLSKYSAYPQIIQNTRKILTTSNVHFDFGDTYPHKNINTYCGSESEDYALLRRLCLEGMPYRYETPGFTIYRRLARELFIIKEKGFVAYFLVNWDIVHYAIGQGYFYVGRGSGANSVVAYLLRITDVDPIELDLYFERFINLYRKNPPDFDIDFSWKDREDITRYIFDRFGWERTALLATYSTFQYRAIVRELGKVFGLPPYEIDRFAEGIIEAPDQIYHTILAYAKRMQGFPSHLSIHAGGIIISEQPIHKYTATSLPPKGYPLTHFDMVVAEDVGLYKFDILSQRGLGKIKDGLEVIHCNCPDDPEIDIHNVRQFFEDEKVKDLLRNGKAIGCFYVESPAMRMLLKKLKADNYLGLVAASSIIRPGVAKSGMMREYILRFRYRERRKEAHPVLWDLMEDTYGVMVYQEDVIKVAHYFAGLTLGEADMLRRGMSGKFRSRDEFLKVKQQFFDNCKAKGHDQALTHDVWRQIESFAGYAFAKGHSASYAVESYQSLYLKAHYPLEFMVAVINNFGGFYRTELYVHEARMHGATIEAPCINQSEALCVIKDTTIFLGFSLIKELAEQTILTLLEERYARGNYRSLKHLVERTDISLEQLKVLIRIGGLRFTGQHKKKLLWEAHFMLASVKQRTVTPLFETEVKSTFELPPLHHDPREDAFDEMELLGFPLCSPFSLLSENNGLPHHVVLVRNMPNYLNQKVTMLGYLIAIKNTSAKKATSTQKQRMHFGTFIDEEGQFIDTVHFPPSAAKYPFRGKGVYRLYGKVVEEFEFYTLEVDQMEKLPYVNLEDVEAVPRALPLARFR